METLGRIECDCGCDNTSDNMVDSPQIELSSKSNPKPFNSTDTWKGGYFHSSNLFPPVYQYPYAGWIPNSICYASKSLRSKTFEKWPKQMRPTAKELVNSGFFYKGYGDSVECFFCGICLHDRESRDSAHAEHRHWSRSCRFVDMASN